MRCRQRPILVGVDRAELADFLRQRRAAMQPEDVGLARTVRRRTTGLRREEVAMVAGMSADYYTRLEQQRGPQPSVSMLAALARALRLSLPERDHLFRLAGHTPPSADVRSDHVSRGLARVLDRVDTPAMVTNDLGETLAQNRPAVALFGDERRFAWGSPERSRWYRWFADPGERRLHAAVDHERLSRSYAAALRVAIGRHPDDRRARQLVDRLAAFSTEFTALWTDHDVSWRPGTEAKHFIHPEVGPLELDCDTLVADSDFQILLIYTATPGSESADRLRLLGVLGDQHFAGPALARPE